MPDLDYVELKTRAGQVFTPGSPVSEQDLFSGRVSELQQIINAAQQRGYHAVLYGERGVGKTSLANILTILMRASGYGVGKTVCNVTDSFPSLWRQCLSSIVFSQQKQKMGFGSGLEAEVTALSSMLPEDISPSTITNLLQQAGDISFLFVFDEFDRVRSPETSTLMSDTIKAFSDLGLDVTVLIVGVASSVEKLLVGHESIERALVQIPMPRMSGDEIVDIVEKGAEKLGMTIEVSAAAAVTELSQGLPFITHLLSLHSFHSAIESEKLHVDAEDIEVGIKRSLDQWQHSVKKAYADATQSSQPGNIYKEVLLACALADTDELGYFVAGGLRRPLKSITGREYDIPNYAQHLKNFTDDTRGPILERSGTTRRRRYRFASPLHRPFITIKGVADGLITYEQMQELQKH